ncbi:type II toxin-antitoxin system Phd/YefM family antitoxin [Psychromonas aquimarina]|uniref:type II toxin-antitoxin system Phd/YefM family antitoxin n=1 Tax=Psychromonas aquimarina TaxID=444919 RepID=UPI001FDF1D5E|nr:type II toxin-antitoxin system Phd/YefM family antitoxin [Psychromonas aquimarina]
MNELINIGGKTIMQALSANDAKTQFGNMLMKVQRAPIQINKNGKPVAVVISVDEYHSIETLKLRLLQSRAAKATNDINNGNTVDGEQFFDELESGQHD